MSLISDLYDEELCLRTGMCTVTLQSAVAVGEESQASDPPLTQNFEKIELGEKNISTQNINKNVLL